jgi:hypothetical protein
MWLPWAPHWRLLFKVAWSTSMEETLRKDTNEKAQKNPDKGD